MPVGGWIPEEHLRYFVETLAMFAGARFDDDDWIGLEFALLRDESSGHERVVTWPVGPVDVMFSSEPGDGLVVISLDASRDLETRADTLVFVLQDAEALREGPKPSRELK